MTSKCDLSNLKYHTLLLPLVFILALLSTVQCGRCSGKESSDALSLEDYLKQLGYSGFDFENTDHRAPRLDASLGNGRKLRFLVDTGWGITSLTPSYARGFKTLGEVGGQLQDPVLGTITNEDMILIDKIVLGNGAQFSNQPARVRDIKADYVTLPYEGVLGLDFLMRNFCLIDCWKHRLYVRATELSSAHAEGMEQSLRQAGFSEVNLIQHGPLNLEARINDHPTRLLIDTGAVFNMLDYSQLKDLGLTLAHYSRPSTGSYIEQEANTSVIGTGNIGLQHLKITKLDSFQLGQRRWKGVYFAVGDLKEWGAAAPGTSREYIKGFLSQDFLAGHGALIDLSRRKLWIRASKPPAQTH